MNNIIFSNKKHGKVNFTMSDFIAWKAYMSDDKQPEIINLHPQADQIIEPKKGRGRTTKKDNISTCYYYTSSIPTGEDAARTRT